MTARSPTIRSSRLRSAATFIGDVGAPSALRIALWGWVTTVITLIVWILLTALKPTAEIFDNPFGLPSTLAWENFASAWGAADFARVTLTRSS